MPTASLAESSPGLEIDIATVMVPAERRIWRLFPGDRYRFIDQFAEQELVFLDFPGLDLPPGRVTHDTPDLLGRVIASRELRTWLTTRSPVQNPPNLDPTAYANSVPSKRDQQFIAALVALFGTAARGDLVLVPDQLRNRQILVGEFTDEPERRTETQFPKRYGRHPILARSVSWLSRADEAKVPRTLTRNLRTSNPMISLHRRFHNDIFDIAYPAYNHLDRFGATFNITGEKFDELDNYFLNELFLIASLFCQQYDRNNLPSEINSITSLEYLSTDEQYRSTQAWDIHSPGTVRLASSAISPLMAVALFGVLAAGGREALAEPPPVTVGNSQTASPDDPCTAAVDERVRGMLNMMGLEFWREQCRRALALEEKAGVKGPGKVKKNSGKGG